MYLAVDIAFVKTFYYRLTVVWRINTESNHCRDVVLDAVVTGILTRIAPLFSSVCVVESGT